MNVELEPLKKRVKEAKENDEIVRDKPTGKHYNIDMLCLKVDEAEELARDMGYRPSSNVVTDTLIKRFFNRNLKNRIITKKPINNGVCIEIKDEDL